MLRRCSFMFVLPLVLSVSQVVAPSVVAAAVTVAPAASGEEEVASVAGPLGGLPPLVDPANRIDGLEPATLPEGDGTAEVDRGWTDIPELPVEVREGKDLPAAVESVQVSVSPQETPAERPTGPRLTTSSLARVGAMRPSKTARPLARGATTRRTTGTSR